MPSYNHGRFIKTAIDSVINQTYHNWELLIIDNNSTDATKNIINSYYEPRIRPYYVSNSGIIAYSRNFGIRKAKGEWIAFLDSDDFWASTKLEICSKSVFNNDFIYHDLCILYDKRPLIYKKRTKNGQLNSDVIKQLLIKGNVINNSSVIVKKSLLIKVSMIDESPALVSVEDYNTWLKIAIISKNFHYIPKVLGFYREHNNGVSKESAIDAFEQAGKAYEYLLSNYEMAQREALINYNKGVHYFKKSEKDLANEFLLKSLKTPEIKIKVKALCMLFLGLVEKYNFFRF